MAVAKQKASPLLQVVDIGSEDVASADVEPEIEW